MKNLFFLFGLIIFCFVDGSAQKLNQSDPNEPRVRIKQTELFETYFTGDKNNRIKGTRNLSGITNYNQTGKVTESISFTNDGNGSYYQKHIYFYDRKNRKSAVYFYISGKAAQGKYFVADNEQSENYSFLMSQLNQTLSKRIFYSYQENERQNEEITIDSKGNIIEKRVSVFNSDGKMIRFKIFKSDMTPTLEVITNYTNNGHLAETVRIEKGLRNFRSIDHYDDQGRQIKGEQFLPGSSAKITNVKDFLLHNRITRKYIGDRTEMEWVFFDAQGSAWKKLIIIDKNDDEISRERYQYSVPDDTGKAVWKLAEREIKKYEYDEYGNWTKSVWLEQEGENEPLVPDLIFERVISYY